MKVLWAPWRMGYILSNDKDEERLILHVGPRSMVMMNRYPYNNGHLLVAPIKHAGGLEQLESKEDLDLILMVGKTVEILKKVMNPDGFNVGLNLGRVAGAGMEEHLHFHIVPRWKGDTNFMTILEDVRVIPEHIMETYKKLLPYYEDLK